MKFCPNCDNILIPKNKKWFCQACEEEFDLDVSKTNDYKIVKKIKHDDKEAAPIVVKGGLKIERISDNDRKAFEEFFGNVESDNF
ncbi:hypothetical protein LCGC14_1290280 [marine sediment metagenome]|uniref:DNA-directed RNA polymerase II subunit RPB9-like zinc ribbon domain-containing protein n=1 Tax=marine sediment metagenome TaxID=412755 RepID=A0A0F9KUC6_9ZZZZ